MVEAPRELRGARARDPPVGRLEPIDPQSAAGTRTEPLVSEPSANGTSPAATAAPDPLDEPPAIRSGSRGLRTGP